MKNKFLKNTIALVALTSSALANAGLIFQVDTLTSNEFTFTLGGTFDNDTIGESEGYLAIKNDWSNNKGVHTEFMNSTPTIFANSISIGGSFVYSSVQNYSYTWNDVIFWSNPLGSENPILAGTSVAGSMTLKGSFDTSALSTLQLVSGFVRPSGADDWARLEAVANATKVPEPSTLVIYALGLIGLASRKYKKRS